MKDLVKNTVLLGAGYLIGKKVAQSRKSPAIGSTGKGIDQTALDEVILFAENDQYLYNALIKNYLPNLEKKIKAGKYNPELATKLLEYYYTVYVRPYMKLPRNYGWDSKLNPAERKEFGRYFRDVLWDDYGLKELFEKKKK
jgi:hypothetical protein